MTLKTKISLLVSLLFTFIYAVSATVVYVLFADFRKDEFENRLKDKAITSIKLLVEVEEVDSRLLETIDTVSINNLYSEKTLIFDSDFNLIYSSLDDTRIEWDQSDLEYLKKNKTFFRRENNLEVYGFFYDTNQEDFYALISANDSYGNRKLEYLLVILIFSYFLFTAAAWVATSYLVKKLFRPLDNFHTKVKSINENNLDTRIAVKRAKDEIDLLANEFNQMLLRIETSYTKQKEFAAQASHELRTPVTRITAQLENRMRNEKEPEMLHFMENLLKDVNQLSDLINSLLLLSKLEKDDRASERLCRIDEVVFEACEIVNRTFPDFKLQLEILESEHEDFLELKANKALMVIVFVNLLKNAYVHSESKKAILTIAEEGQKLKVEVSNDGQTLSEKEQEELFQPFMRGENSKNKSGLGLGLRIVWRILSQQNGEIRYRVEDGQNVFELKFRS
ncbi:HAMP domain-containing histidine kinase [Marinilongibacter aquaticus]|uniref:sensor histidine kinase n=1 Tax=Marinilongibacter aquaticus TaxID=2975157 RepID=UPI0021BD4B68|nr:HAMP domain-containing sensor histidine kinase [Marinilongibacter aquaticus]UBM58173.1 HAMP domain-containing histidine kinase [Marinilongibacter aquaticus]